MIHTLLYTLIAYSALVTRSLYIELEASKEADELQAHEHLIELYSRPQWPSARSVCKWLDDARYGKVDA